jgi:HEAT repeat protein
MADIDAFRKKVEELLTLSRKKQKNLAAVMGYTSEALNRLLHNPNLKCDRVELIVVRMVELGAITFRRDVIELLMLMDCEAGAQAAQFAELLNKLKPDPSPSLNRQEEMALHRRKYLERLSQYAQFAKLPIAPRHSYPFQHIFQALKLRQDPLAAEDLPFSERRALLDEPSRGEHDPRRLVREQEPERAPESWRNIPQVVIADGLEDALQRSKGRALVLGPPGSGKTTVLKAFAGDLAQRALAHPAAMIPILIQLHLLSGTDYTLQSALRVMLGALGVDEQYARALWHEIEHGRAYLCIDGLDEVPANQREMVVSWISALAFERGNRWIISSRYAEYHNGLFRREQFYEWELQPLSPPIRQRLAEGLIREVHHQLHGADAASGRNARAFLRALEKHPRVSTWGKNPLLVSLTAVVFVFTGTIPTSRADLFQQVINAVLETRQGDQERRARLRRAASFLALKFFLKERRTITYETLLDLLDEYSPSLKGNEGLAHDLLHSGLLEVVAEDTYGYWHSTYQEYFAALELAKRLTSDDWTLREHTQQLIDKQRTKGQWIEILRLLVGVLLDQHGKGGAQQALDWLHTLVDPYTQPGEHDPGNLGLELAVQSLGEIGAVPTRWNDREWRQLEDAAAQAWVQALLEAGDHQREGRQERLVNLAEEIGHFGPSAVKSVKQQLTAALAHHPAQTRAAAIRALGKLGKDVPTNTLVEAFGDKHASVREAAVRALVELEEDAPFALLVKQALKSKRLVVRVAATRALGELRQPSSVKRLLLGLSHEAWSLREATVLALGNLGEQAPVKPLLNCLHDEKSAVRQAAVAALGMLGGHDNDGPLLAVLHKDRNDSVRAEVLRVLGKRTPVEDVLVEIMCPPHFVPYNQAYREAAELLREVEEQAIQEVLSHMSGQGDQDPWATVQAIRESQQEPSTEKLLAYLSGTNQQLCYLAANLLGRRNEWALLEQFVTSVEEGGSGHARAIAARLLGRLGETAPLHLLVAAFADQSPVVRLAAVQAFEEMGARTPPEAAAVVSLLSDSDRTICTAAIRVVTHLSQRILVDVPLLEALFTAYENPSRALAQAALTCLDTLKKRVTPDQFAALMRHENALRRLEVMNKFGEDAPLTSIVGILQDTDVRVRSKGFGEIATRDYQGEVPLELLLHALEDESGLVRLYASTALRNRGEGQLVAVYLDENGVPFFPHRTKTTSRTEEPPWATKNWDDGILATLSMLHDERLSGRPDPGPDEELSPMDEAEKQAARKRARADRLLADLDADDAEERLRVLQVLEKDVSEEHLQAALDDEDGRVRRKALQVLAERTPLSLLARALSDEYPFVRDVAAALLRSRRDHVSEQDMRALLESGDGIVRAATILALEDRLPRALLQAMLGESEERVRLAAFDVLREVYPELLPGIQAELTALLAGTGSSRIVNAAVESFLCDLMRNMDEVPLFWREKLTSLLDPSWYWEVRVKAAQALGKLRRDIPQEAVERLKAMRNDPGSRAAQMAADDALAEILSFEPSVDEVL